MPKGKPHSESPSDSKYNIETRSKTRAKALNVAKSLTSEMSATQTVTETQESQVPAETGQFNAVPVNQTQIQQDRSSKTQKPKRNNQTGTVGLGASSIMAATTGTVQTTRTSDANVATLGPSNPKETMGTVDGTGAPKQQQAGKLGPPPVSATTSNSSLASVGVLNACLAEPSHRNDTLRRHGSSTSEMEMRRRREADERHARDYEERLHERWKAEDRFERRRMGAMRRGSRTRRS